MKSKKLTSIMNDDKSYLFQNYGDRLPVAFVRSDKNYLYDQDGNKYIDFLAGIAVTNLGYAHASFIKALTSQTKKLLHTSNWFYNKEQIETAKLLSRLSFKGKSLFVNSGAEANEAAIKLARRYGLSHSEKKINIISFKMSFHGRTFGSMSATAQEKIHKGFGPVVPGFMYLPYNDIKAFRKAVKSHKKIAAIIIELVQGEGGINIADNDFVTEVFALCEKHNILTIVDEVQTGVGRTGKNFAYQYYTIKPDIITLAKGLGNGIPIGVLHAKDHLAQFLPQGAHGSTFGGNHLASVAAYTVLTELSKKSFLSHVTKLNKHIIKRLKDIQNKTDLIQEIRGLGLHIGIEITKPGFDIVKKALSKGLIINCTADRVLRIMPPLTMSLTAVNTGLDILEKILIEEV